MSKGARRYLVPDDKLLAFCNAVNQGVEPRDSDYGDFDLKEGHEAIAVEGFPTAPEAWKAFLLKAPLRGTVVELLPDFKARINIGKKDGLRVGMELLPTEEYLFSDQEVISLEADHAVIRTKYPNGRYRLIAIGDVVSTRRPKPGTSNSTRSLHHVHHEIRWNDPINLR